MKPRDRTAKVAIIGVTFGSLAVIAFGLRIFSKIHGSSGVFGVDDYVMSVLFSYSPLDFP